ncbi:50S ribosomal protein L6 [Candidatus Parcubacteria bacterium]|nr:50S ribosomal protein L6 [Candidatus Parcubacteria bacterium]
MSRLGQKPIQIPEKTELKIEGNLVTAKGPLGELKVELVDGFELKQEGNELTINPTKKGIEFNALWGTYVSLIKNAIEGVNQEFEKKLIIEGVGYRAAVQGNKLVLNVGFSHQVELEILEGLKVEVEKDTISVKGIDKQKVGHFASVIRSTKKPEPYKGKGIRYHDEIIRRKEGKKTV